MDKQANNIIKYESKGILIHQLELPGNKIINHTFKDGHGEIEYEHDIYELCKDYLYGQPLTRVQIPESVKKIDKGALRSCHLEEFTLGKHVTNIVGDALTCNEHMTKLNVENGNTVYDSRNDCNAIIESKTNTMIRATQSTTVIPKSVMKIIVNDDSFSWNNYPAHISVEDGNPVYDSRKNCNAIIETATNTLVLATKSLAVIPDSVINIAENAFKSCNFPSHICVAEGNPRYDSRDDCDAIIDTASNTLILGFDSAFIPSSVTCIGPRAFCESKIKSITIPSSVVKIEEEAFSCWELTEVIFEEGLKEIGAWAFFCCHFDKIKIPDSVEIIGDHAFYSCYYLKEVILGKGLKKIGDWAFAGTECLDGTKNARKMSVTINGSEPPIKHRGDFTSVTSINIPDTALSKYTNDSNWSDLANKMGEYRMLDNLKNKKTEVQIVRLKVLDRCFRSSEGFTMKGLCEACGKTLADRGLMPMSSDTEYMKRTIYNDMKYIRETLKADIEKCNGHGHQPHYRYADPTYSMFGKNKSNTSGNLFDAREIGNALSVLQQFSDIPGFEQVGKVINDLQERLGLEQSGPSILFDVRQENSGTEYIETIQGAISAKHALKITYREAVGIKVSFTVHPYNLTQRDGCWYLFCYKDGSAGKDDITTLELFRIEKITKAKVPYIDNDFDICDYLYDVMGVHVVDDMSPVKITLQFSSKKFAFVEKNPIHGSQVLVKDQPRTVIINVQPNDDFYKAMLELGGDVEILSPQPVRERMRELTQTVANMYK